MYRRVDYLVGGEDFTSMTAGQFMQSDVFFYSKNTTGEKLTLTMTAEGFGAVPIVDRERRVVGIVTEFDLLRALRDGKGLEEVTAGEIMTPDPICVREDTKSEELMRILQEHHLIRVPVIDEKGRLVGIAARRDILQGYLRSRGEQQPYSGDTILNY